MNKQEQYMRRAIELAVMGFGNVSPNPMVGCVIVHNDQIIGEGYHRKYGGPHAEVNAIESVEDKSLLKESVLYVSLEPCSHWGKTPPCADLIIKHQIPKVVIAGKDPYHEVNGSGIEKMRAAGIEVVSGVLDKENRWLNRRFFIYNERKRPYIILKWAQTSDGFIASITDGSLQRTVISNEFSNQLNHRWRSLESAIMVGFNTAIIDDPELTVRGVDGKNPVRVVLDKNLELPQHLKIFNDVSAQTLVINEKENSESGHVKRNKIDFLDPDKELLHVLYENKIQSLIIEGGSKTLERFIMQDLWDEVRIITSSNKLEKGYPAPEFALQPEEEFKSGSDIIRVYFNKHLNT